MSIRRAPRPVAAVLLSLLALFLLVEALVFFLAGDAYTRTLVEMMERTMPDAGSFQAGLMRTFERFMPITMALWIGTGLVQLIVGLLIPTRGWARIAGIVIAVMSVAFTVPAGVALVILPDLAVPRPLFMWLDPSIGVPLSLVTAAVLTAMYVAVIIDLARRPPLREATGENVA